VSDGQHADAGDDELDGEPTSEHVQSRAEGRPPEERSSENPVEQAEVILEESEERIAEESERSEE
jgi:hypothetical protein